MSSKHLFHESLSNSMTHPNEVIHIETGEYQIRLTEANDEIDFNIRGSLSFHWFPKPGLRLTGTYPSSANWDKLQQARDKFILITGGLQTCDLFITSIKMGQKREIEAVANGPSVLGDTSIECNKFRFVLPNFKDFYGDWIEINNNSWAGRLTMETKNLRYTIDAKLNHKELRNTLQRNGGYLLLHNGRIEILGKSTLSYSHLQEELQLFNTYLTFVNGRKTGCMFVQGLDQSDACKWTDLTPSKIDTFKYVISWNDWYMAGSICNLLPEFDKKWQNKSDREFLSTCIHWYTEANGNSGMVDGSIIFAQAALELIFNYVVVEKRKIIRGRDSETLSASNKLRMTLSTMNISFDLSNHYQELNQFINNNNEIRDAVDAIVSLRNSLVHGNLKKGLKYTSIPNRVKYQALQLAIKYIELSILFTLGYKGEFVDRTSPEMEKTKVPWA